MDNEIELHLAENSATSTGRRLQVLQSYSEPSVDDNPFLALHTQSLRPLVDVVHFTWRAALFDRYDVFHVHWLDSLVSGRGRARTVMAWAASSLLILRLYATKTPVVRTLHNSKVRGGGESLVVRTLVRAFDALTTLDIRMNRSEQVAGRPDYVFVPHGHYADWYKNYDVPQKVTGRFLIFGLMRSYKGIPGLLDAFRSSPGDEMSLHLVGRIVETQLEKLMETAAENDPRITVVNMHATEAHLANEIGEAEIVVLPYTDFYNSGSALLALSLGRPILVPESAASSELRDEFGPRWVHTYTGMIAAGALRDALDVTADPVLDTGPNLEARQWGSIAATIQAVYTTAQSTAGNRPSIPSLRRSAR